MIAHIRPAQVQTRHYRTEKRKYQVSTLIKKVFTKKKVFTTDTSWDVIISFSNGMSLGTSAILQVRSNAQRHPNNEKWLQVSLCVLFLFFWYFCYVVFILFVSIFFLSFFLLKKDIERKSIRFGMQGDWEHIRGYGKGKNMIKYTIIKI